MHTKWNDIAPDEPHVHQPTTIMTITECENPDLIGIRCGVCLIPFDMTQAEWHKFLRFWVFGRFE